MFWILARCGIEPEVLFKLFVRNPLDEADLVGDGCESLLPNHDCFLNCDESVQVVFLRWKGEPPDKCLFVVSRVSNLEF